MTNTFLFFVIVCIAGAFTAPTAPVPIPEKVISLDVKSRERWQAAIREIISDHGFNYTFAPVIDYVKSFGTTEWTIIELISTGLDRYLPSEYVEEIRGLVDVAEELGYGSQLPMSMIVGINLLYEFSSGCTSIACVDAEDRVWHARNMDWSVGRESFRNITVVADFQKGGMSQFKVITWVGYVGALTGMRLGAFSVTVDQRDSAIGRLSVAVALERLFLGHGSAVGFLVRDVLANNGTYEDALETLAHASVTTPVYLIIAGTHGNEGAVVTRTETGDDVWSIPDGPEPWFVIETNYDHGSNPPREDDRRDLAIGAMRKMGQQGISSAGLMGVLDNPPANGSRGVLNDETLYSVIMSPVQNIFQGCTRK